MNFDFSAVLAKLGTDAAVTIANAARPAGDYLFASLLPEINRPTYDAKSASMTIRSTMAGLVGMDAPYPPTGVIEASTFNEQIAKVANWVPLSEQALRELQAIVQAGGVVNPTTDFLQTEVLNFLNKVIVQPHLDTAEYMRGEALVAGALTWTFNKKTLNVSYGVPAANLLTARTGNDGYGGSTSKFWEDMKLLRTRLKNNVRAYIAHPTTIDMIIANSVNSIQVAAQNGLTFSLKRYVTIGGNTVVSSDARESLVLIGYDKEGEILDPTNPGTTIKVPFMSTGKLLAVGNNTDAGYRVGQGATVNPLDAQRLGYTHIGPTVEGGGKMGRWSRLRTPDQRPWSIEGEGVTNLLPVIEAPDKIAVATTDMV